MQTVSPTYSPYSKERRSTVSVVFKLVDIDAINHASAAATSEAEISKIGQTFDETINMSRKIGTLEKDQFLLDGSYRFPDADNGQVGWWSGALSNALSEFDVSQVLEFNFTEPESSVGFTIFFDDLAKEVPTDFTVEAFDGTGTLINSETVTGNNKTKYVSETPSDGYRKLRLTFTKTSKPYKRVRVCEVTFGIVQTFDEGNTTDLNILYELSPDMESLPSNEMTITIDNVDRKYNLINPQGLYKYLQQGQDIDVQIGINGESVSMGKFYFTKSSAEDSSMTAQITANDKIHTLDGSVCRIGTDGTWTVLEAVNAVMADSGLSVVVDIPSVIANRSINKCIPQDTTHRQALRMIAQAGMSTCYFNRGDILAFTELAEGVVVDTLDDDNMYLPPKVSVNERINVIEIASTNEYTEIETIYTASNKEVGETDRVKSISNPLVNSNDVAIWLLGIYSKRIRYETQERGNPAVELTDTVKIYDAYNENRNVIITKQEFKYDGVLSSRGGGL